jgi:P pilus assembly chaperone PapD
MKNLLKLSLIVVLLGVVGQVFAQKFEVAPTRMDFNLEPGQNGQMILNIKNHADVKKSYTATLSDWTVDEKGNIAYAPVNTTAKSCADWVTISPALFELQPNESKKIRVILNVPPGEEANATKWAMLFIQEAAEQNATIGVDKSTSAGITINPSIGIYIFQSPGSYANESAVIENFKEVEKNKSMSVDVFNTGDKIIQGKVYMIISNLETAEETQLDAVEFTLIPGVRKTITLDLPKDIAPGSYSFTGVLDYSPERDLEGVVIDYKVE